MRRNARRWVAVLAVVAGSLATPGIAAASGGGGCGRAVTDERGTTVEIEDFCFGPTILRVDPGQVVTFANRDSFPHVVLGANGVWGSYQQVRGNHEVQYRFDRSGVYPFVCTYHPGMIGAVVVADGAGPGAAGSTTTAAGPVTLVEPEARTAPVVAAVPPPAPNASMRPWQIVLAGVALLALAGGIALVARRRGGREVGRTP